MPFIIQFHRLAFVWAVGMQMTCIQKMRRVLGKELAEITSTHRLALILLKCDSQFGNNLVVRSFGFDAFNPLWEKRRVYHSALQILKFRAI